MFVELLFRFNRIVTLLLEIRADQKAIRVEQQRQAAVLDQILEAVILPVAESLQLTGDVEGVITTGEQAMRLSESQQGSFTLAATTKSGKPARVDGVPTWTIQAGMESSIGLEVAPDGMSAVVKGKDFADGEPNVKSLSILVAADADLGEGVKPIEVSGSIELIRDEATVLSLKEGTVTDQ